MVLHVWLHFLLAGRYSAFPQAVSRLGHPPDTPMPLRAITDGPTDMTSPGLSGPQLADALLRRLIPKRDSPQLLALLDSTIRLRLLTYPIPEGVSSVSVHSGCVSVAVHGEFTVQLSTLYVTGMFV